MAESFIRIQERKHNLLSIAGWTFMNAYKTGTTVKPGSINGAELSRMKQVLNVNSDKEVYSIANQVIRDEVDLRVKLSHLFSKTFAAQLGTSRYTDQSGSCNASNISRNLDKIWYDNYAHVSISWNTLTEKYVARWETTEPEQVRYITIGIKVVGNNKGHFLGGIRDDKTIYLFDPNGKMTFYQSYNGHGHEEFSRELIKIVQRKFKTDTIKVETGPVFNTLELNNYKYGKGNCTCWVIFLQKLYWDLRDRSVIGNIGYIAMLDKVKSKIPKYVFMHLFMNFCSYLFKLI